MTFWVAVAVHTPAHSRLGGPLAYACEAPLPAGTLVRVPLGKREVLGVVWGPAVGGKRRPPGCRRHG